MSRDCDFPVEQRSGMHVDVPCPARHLLERFLLGRVPAAEAELLERHLTDCATCGATLDELGAEDALVATMRSRSPILAEVDGVVVRGLVRHLRGLVTP